MLLAFTGKHLLNLMHEVLVNLLNMVENLVWFLDKGDEEDLVKYGVVARRKEWEPWVWIIVEDFTKRIKLVALEMRMIDPTW